MYKVIVFFNLFIISSCIAMLKLPHDYTARENMTMCFQNVKNGYLDNAYALFVTAISDKNDDPGYYPILSKIAKKIPNSNVYEMWNEYGITDYAREVFLNTPKNILEHLLKKEIISGNNAY